MSSRETVERGSLTLRLLIVFMAGFVLLAALFVLLRYGVAKRVDPTAPDSTKAFVTLEAPRGELGDFPREFSWAPVPGAVSYRVKISDEDAVWPMFLKTTDHPPLVLEPQEASALTRGRIHFWEVEALGQDGAQIATGSVRFWITPPAGSGSS